MGNRTPVNRTIQNCSIYSLDDCPNNSARLPIHGLQVVKALIMNELHASGDMPEAAQECEELLSAALEEGELRDTIQDVANAQRRVVHDDGHLLVLDSRIGEHWQRCVQCDPENCGEYSYSCLLYTSPSPRD